ncbi:TcaA second domain-containing protein [Alkalicoccobacillus porphyridii]|uniref:Zinc ribbon domain-containing protein n=1 Tax=Alkalicoccobacillus porphyridii TaxID=2597270 RepID=A0A554A494_9BACI|nr:hypothetical protein [Alkalicoccobacillus porphyridii]TSB48502.1 hypothetical protein FN960_02820 [Alkalicoccobacillus porphyridii]
MKICPQCHTQNQDQPFCSKCGAKLPETASPQQTKEPMKTSKKILIGSVAGIAVLAGGLFFTGKALADKDRVVNSFLEAVADQNTKAIKKHLGSNREGLTVEDKHVEDFLVYLEEDEDAKAELIKKWLSEAESIDDPRMVSYYDGYYNDFPIYFTKTGKKWLLFDEYQFVMEAKPLYVESNIELDEITFTLDEEKVEPEYDEQGYFFGHHLPGIYQVTGNMENDFGVNEKSVEADLYYQDYYTLYFDLEIASLYMDSIINGTKLVLEDSKKELDVTSSPMEFGPLLTDGTLSYHLEADSPFGLLKSNSLPLYYENMDHALAPNDELKKELGEMINEYLLGYRVASQEKNVDKLVHASGVLYNWVEKEIHELKMWDEYFAGYLLESGIAWEQAEIFESASTWGVYVPVYEKWEQAVFNSGEIPELEHEEYHRIYEFAYQDDVWKMVDVNVNAYYFDPTETFEFSKEDQDEVSATEAVVKEGAKIKLSQYDADELIFSFASEYADAVRHGVPSYVDDYVTSDYKKKIEPNIMYFFDNGIDEYLINAEATNLSANDDGSYTMTTKEIYEIYHPKNGDKVKTFTTTYTVVYDEDDYYWKISELVGEPKEIKSEDI